MQALVAVVFLVGGDAVVVNQVESAKEEEEAIVRKRASHKRGAVIRIPHLVEGTTIHVRCQQAAQKGQHLHNPSLIGLLDVAFVSVVILYSHVNVGLLDDGADEVDGKQFEEEDQRGAIAFCRVSAREQRLGCQTTRKSKSERKEEEKRQYKFLR